MQPLWNIIPPLWWDLASPTKTWSKIGATVFVFFLIATRDLKNVVSLPTPNTWYQVLSTWPQVPSKDCLVPRAKYLVGGAKYLVPNSKYLVPSTKYFVPGTQYLVLRTWYEILHTLYQVLRIWCPIQITWYRTKYLATNMWSNIWATVFLNCSSGSQQCGFFTNTKYLVPSTEYFVASTK